MKVGHIGINVNNIQRSKEFYAGLFGFDLMRESSEEGKKFAFLGNKGKLFLTLWEQSDKPFSSSNAGLHHLAFELENMEKLKIFENTLEVLGVEKIYDKIVSHTEASGSGGLYFLDPDGIRLEVCVSEGMHECSPASTNGPSCGFF
jgi:catechol 2,3-dioxygenase-like lactoylglutathione lyase family enzyme